MSEQDVEAVRASFDAFAERGIDGLAESPDEATAAVAREKALDAAAGQG